MLISPRFTLRLIILVMIGMSSAGCINDKPESTTIPFSIEPIQTLMNSNELIRIRGNGFDTSMRLKVTGLGDLLIDTLTEHAIVFSAPWPVGRYLLRLKHGDTWTDLDSIAVQRSTPDKIQLKDGEYKIIKAEWSLSSQIKWTKNPDSSFSQTGYSRPNSFIDTFMAVAILNGKVVERRDVMPVHGARHYKGTLSPDADKFLEFAKVDSVSDWETAPGQGWQEYQSMETMAAWDLEFKQKGEFVEATSLGNFCGYASGHVSSKIHGGYSYYVGSSRTSKVTLLLREVR